MKQKIHSQFTTHDTYFFTHKKQNKNSKGRCAKSINCYHKADLLGEQSVLTGSYCAPLNDYCTVPTRPTFRENTSFHIKL